MKHGNMKSKTLIFINGGSIIQNFILTIKVKVKSKHFKRLQVEVNKS